MFQAGKIGWRAAEKGNPHGGEKKKKAKKTGLVETSRRVGKNGERGAAKKHYWNISRAGQTTKNTEDLSGKRGRNGGEKPGVRGWSSGFIGEYLDRRRGSVARRQRGGGKRRQRGMKKVPREVHSIWNVSRRYAKFVGV